jgi:hypothetical protein
MSSHSDEIRARAANAANEAERPTQPDRSHRLGAQRSDSTSSAEEKQSEGFPAVGKAMAPLTQPINYAIKGTTRTLNGTVGVTTTVANGLVSGTTSVLGHTAEAALPKGVFSFSWLPQVYKGVPIEYM